MASTGVTSPAPPAGGDEPVPAPAVMPTSPAPAPAADAMSQADRDRLRALRRMRALATGLLGLAAVVYVVTLGHDGAWGGFVGYVNAGAEASMVGAIADWFAVTALFRHPLGLPVPHTALIPRRKDELGRSLQDFVGENFLAESVIRERLESATVSARVGDWLVVEANARRVVDEVSEVAAVALTRVRDDHIESLMRDALVPRFHEQPISPLLGGLLSEAFHDKVHHGLVDLLLGELVEWLRANPRTVQEVLTERAPKWSPDSVNERVTARVHLGMVRWVEDIRADPQHRARIALDSALDRLADDLLHDPDLQARTERLKDRLLEHPAVVSTAVDLWNALRRALTESLADPEGVVRIRATDELVRFAHRLRDEPALRDRIDGLAADSAVYVVGRYGRELTSVITQTIERWDGREASDRIELHVGRDLQFIRINGTVVGGLVGVIIHVVSVLLT